MEKNELIPKDKKNITDGKIKLNIEEEDKVPDEYHIELKENFVDSLDQKPKETSSYLESNNDKNLYLKKK